MFNKVLSSLLLVIPFCNFAYDSAEIIIRPGRVDDYDQLKTLYRRVASVPGGLARTADEITDEYITYVLSKCLENGIIFVAEYHGQLVGVIAKYKIVPKIFSHMLYEGSVLVDPDFQGQGIGTALITHLQEEIKTNHPEIYRVNFLARVSNPAIKLYKRLGIVIEGVLKGTTQGLRGKLENDVFMAWYNPNCNLPLDELLYYAQ